jgi:protein disulfide-isomerase-like protein
LYPALKLYVNGHNTTTYPENNLLTPEALLNWTKKEYKKYAPKISSDSAPIESKWKFEVAELKKMAEKSIQFELFGNTNGKVMELTDHTFTILTNQSAWFVMFYAPWCGHCHKLLPIWDELAMTVKGKLNIAKVDCTQNSKTCSKNNVQGYPTLKLFLDGVSNAYEGDRQLYPLRDFALSFSTKVPFDVVSATEISALIKKNEVNYFYVYDGNQPEQKGILVNFYRSSHG